MVLLNCVELLLASTANFAEITPYKVFEQRQDEFGWDAGVTKEQDVAQNNARGLIAAGGHTNWWLGMRNAEPDQILTIKCPVARVSGRVRRPSDENLCSNNREYTHAQHRQPKDRALTGPHTTGPRIVRQWQH